MFRNIRLRTFAARPQFYCPVGPEQSERLIRCDCRQDWLDRTSCLPRERQPEINKEVQEENGKREEGQETLSPILPQRKS
jgi:hypothetical protein